MLKNRFKEIFHRIRHRSILIYNKDYNPAGIKFADGSSIIIEPRRIIGENFLSIGSNVRIEPHGWLAALSSYKSQQFTPKISIGNNIFIGHYCCITAINEIIIEDGCLFSEYVYISDHGHGIDPRAGSPASQPLFSKGKTIIGQNTFIGYNACVLPGVILGKHCVVGANSVVTKSFPDYSMIGGSPARLLKTYSHSENKWIEIS